MGHHIPTLPGPRRWPPRPGRVASAAMAVTAPRRLAFDLSRGARMWMARSPRLLPLMMHGRRARVAPFLVDARSELVIDGPARSANTFSVQAFRMANPSTRMAHHMHAPGHILRAVRIGVPTIVLLRRPRDAVISEVIREPRKSVRRALLEWISFYEGVAPVLDRVVVANFDLVTSDYATIIDAVNRRFDRSFVPYRNGALADTHTFAVIEGNARARGKTGLVLESQVPRPSDQRGRDRARLEQRYDGPAHCRLVTRAARLHALFAAAAPRPDGPPRAQ